MRDRIRDRNRNIDAISIKLRYKDRIEDENNTEYNIKIDFKKENKEK